MIVARIPHMRVLRALMPDKITAPSFTWPLLTRVGLSEATGYAPTSGTITRILHGMKKGMGRGGPHAGLLGLGHVQEVLLNIDGVTEVSYRITIAGVHAYRTFVRSGGDLPDVKDAISCTNKRQR
jgi:hypothetical protein